MKVFQHSSKRENRFLEENRGEFDDCRKDGGKVYVSGSYECDRIPRGIKG